MTYARNCIAARPNGRAPGPSVVDLSYCLTVGFRIKTSITTGSGWRTPKTSAINPKWKTPISSPDLRHLLLPARHPNLHTAITSNADASSDISK